MSAASDAATKPPQQIRRATESDLDAINRVSNHYIETTHLTFDTETYSSSKRREWFARFADTGRYQLFVAVRGSDFLGFAHSGPLRDKGAYDTSVETTVYLDPEARGVGTGTRLYEVLLDALRAEDVHRAYAGLALPNPASAAFHERFGFREIGTYHEAGRKFGRYWSVCWYELAISKDSSG